MTNEETIGKLIEMRLTAMAGAFREQLTQLPQFDLQTSLWTSFSRPPSAWSVRVLRMSAVKKAM